MIKSIDRNNSYLINDPTNELSNQMFVLFQIRNRGCTKCSVREE